MTTFSADAAQATASPVAHSHELQVARKLRPMTWIATILIGLVAAEFVRGLANNPNLQWDVAARYFSSPLILAGLWNTLQLTVVAMAIGIALGAVLATMRMSSIPLIAAVSWLYVWFFRGTPLLVQIIFWFNLSFLTPRLAIGIPFGPELFGGPTNDLITPWTAAIIALSLCEAAYMAEIIRGGLSSIDSGQSEAAHSLGLTRLQTLRRIVFPQAMRVIVPPTGNQVIGMLKTTSLVSVIAVPELLYSAQMVYTRTYQVIPLLIVASIWYLIVSTVLTVGQYYIERHYAKGAHRTLPPTPLQRARVKLHRFLPARDSASVKRS
jgi:polar amino acid transport system permease protein